MLSDLDDIGISVIVLNDYFGVAGLPGVIFKKGESASAICSMCLDMKVRIHDGEEVSREEATSSLNLFVGMNGRLKARTQQMTPVQRDRFESIGTWFKTGRRPMHAYPLDRPNFLAPQHHLHSSSPDPANILMPVRLEGKNISSENITNSRHNAFLLIEMSVPNLSYGIRAGLLHGRWGGYMALRSNFQSDHYDYTCTSDGKLPSGGMIWASQGKQISNSAYSVGAMYKATSWLAVYAGGGYGTKTLLWEDVDGRWAKVSDCSYKGVAAETGVLLSWRKLAFSAGISTISFKTASLCFGIGVLF